MNDNKAIAVILSVLFLCLGGCCTMREYQQGLTNREMEKTKQMQIQSRIDSMKIANKHF